MLWEIYKIHNRTGGLQALKEVFDEPTKTISSSVHYNTAVFNPGWWLTLQITD